MNNAGGIKRAAGAVLALCLVLLLAGALGAAPVCAGEIKSKYITLKYKNKAQLDRFAKKITKSQKAFSRALDDVMGPGKKEKTQNLGAFLDRLLKRVQRAMDMHVARIHINIVLLDKVSDVVTAYRKVTGGRKVAHQNYRPPAFFWNKNKTIYIQVQRVHVGMVAHEMAHAVQYKYFRIPPPLKVQEMLCMYVDREISAGRF